MKRLPAQPNKSLIHGITVLQALASQKEPIACSFLAKELELDVTLVNRLLKTLDHLGFAYRTQDRKYGPGTAMHVLAAQTMAGSGLIARAMPTLQSLAIYKRVVALGVLWQDKVSYLYHWEPGLPSFSSALGRISLFPASLSSIGVVLLSERTDNEIREIYRNRKIEGHVSFGAFLKAIRKTREQGYAIVRSKEESVAVKLGTPAYAAIALSGQSMKGGAEAKAAILKQAVVTIEKL